ncbi:hypothetical protein J19TS2_49410 [Cohnella xylanilytica]|uniref:Aspartyl-phosphate phosphatase Spo0E family protein n=1 Tax=Cohnella xylanilytica TaxID=557555 RepID=A0A841TRY0_9BACL|nr:aspartyl-phosphate phosphatase Spo0E family protein [Cohnella xylanilytica]MBB6691056.1 aspartyl-phosphate phosphatase Spo0E family protein [Cohnella xylanilytica]GIO15386.1 hypothetical protein J19TS2_49410 [Cohnella xylanilytica]
MDTQLLIHRLQLLQNKLYDMANVLGNLTDPEIVAVSEEADRLIVQLQKHHMNEHGRKGREGDAAAGTLFTDPQAPEKVG